MVALFTSLKTYSVLITFTITIRLNKQLYKLLCLRVTGKRD